MTQSKRKGSALPEVPAKKAKEENSQENASQEDAKYKFWESSQDVPAGLLGDRSGIKWSTLEHNGVLFPPEYEPHGIPIQYDGATFALRPEEEEVATMFAVMRKFEYYTNPVFRRNFFREWTNILNKRPEGHPIRDLNRCSFDAIYNHFETKRLERLAKSKEEKKAIKLARDEQEMPYKYCTWDGRKEMVGNFRVEPPGLFRGRGKHPKMGCLKTRIQPEDVIINCGKESRVPCPPAGHRWKGVVNNRNVVWLACWKDPISGTMKAVFPSVLSSVRACADQVKYEKARSLKGIVDSIRSAYTKDFNSAERESQQRAVCMYFIDKLALRVGGDKELDAEADTVGCTSLRVEHIKLHPPCSMELDFLGKDSIRYQNTVEVLPRVYALLEKFIRGKSAEADLFDMINSARINKYLKSFMDGLTAKVFRTFNASQCLDEEVWENTTCPAEWTIPEKVAYFNAANTKVAVLCNHQRTTVDANFDAKMGVLDYKEKHLEKSVERLEKFRDLWNKAKNDKERLAIVKQWNAEEDAVQLEWLEAYGTEQDKAQLKKDQKERAGKIKTMKLTVKPKSAKTALKKRVKAKTSKTAGKPKVKKATAKSKTKKVKKSAAKRTVKPSQKKATSAKKIVIKRKSKTAKKQPTKRSVQSTTENGRIQIKRKKQ